MKKIIAGLLIFMTINNTKIIAQTWNGSVSSDWNTGANWTPGNIPLSSGNVIINNAAASHQPVLAGNVNISSLTMSAGILNLNNFTLTCAGNAVFTGDSLLNGKVIANTFDNVANMHMGDKLILEKTGPSNEFWGGNNKFYGDSLIIVWRLGALHLENTTSSPDSIFGNLKVQLMDGYSVAFSVNATLYVQNNLLVDNTGNGTFTWSNSNGLTVIGGNMIAQNFSASTPNLPLKNITTLGNNSNGPFYCHIASIDNCNFNGDFTLVADSNVTINIHNSVLSGADNLLQGGDLDVYNNQFGQEGNGTTILRAAHNLTFNVLMRDGNNKFLGNAQWETYAVYPGGLTIQQTYYGADTCLGNMTYVLKGNAALTTNSVGHSYVGGNVIIDGQGASKWVQFTGGTDISFNVNGNFTAKNFTPLYEPGITSTNVYLRNVYVSGTDTAGTFYCFTGDINNSSFNGNFKLVADSSQVYSLNNSLFLGTDNFFQGGNLDVQSDKFGQTGTGTTILRAAHNLGYNVLMRDGNNKFFGNAQWETYASYPGGLTIQQTFYGADTCLGNMTYILKGNAALTTNSNGHSYVAGNVIIDGQGTSKWVQFTGGNDISFNVNGNFTAKNFTPLYEPGITSTNVYLRNVYVSGTDTAGTFYCFTGDINNSSFKGNFKLIADSSQPYALNNSFFLGTDNLFQAGNLDVQNNRFGQTGTGTTILRAAHNLTFNVLMRDGNNKFFGNAQWETYAVYPGGLTIQQTFYGADTCLGNMSYILKGNAALTTNGAGNSYVAGNVIIDGQGARKWIQFTGGGGVSFNVGGNFTVKNLTPFSEPGAGITNVLLHNLNVAGADTIGTFYCYTGDIQNSNFNGSLKVIADSSQLYALNNSLFLGADNLFQAGNLDIQSSRFGQTATGTTILRVAHNLSTGVLMRDGNNKFLGDVEWQATAPSNGSILIQQTFYGADTSLGNLAVNLIGPASANLAGNNLYIGKGLSLQNDGGGVIVHDNGATAIHFIGADTANYSFGGTGSAPSILNIEMNRKGGLRLQSPLSYSGTLTFTRGVIVSSSLNPLSILSGATVSGPWDSSYVDGPVSKTGNTAFTFPLGIKNIYAPISITAPSLVSDVFRAQYFKTTVSEAGYDTTQHDVTLDHLSRSEYWLLDRTNGTAMPKVTLSWKQQRSGKVDAIADLRVAHWNGTTWKDEGNGGTTGTNEEGTIESSNNITNFSPFTLASISASNALPVTFLLFNATLQSNHSVLLRWKTAQEINNAYFEVQKSMDGKNWSSLTTLLPRPSHEYEAIDNTLVNGTTYYRIKQVDIDNNFMYSTVRAVKITGDNKLYLWPNPVSDYVFIETGFAKGSIEISDVNGRIVWKKIINNSLTTIPVKQMAKGLYLVKIVKYDGSVFTERFVKE